MAIGCVRHRESYRRTERTGRMVEMQMETGTEMQTDRELPLEESFEVLEELISRLEAEDITLEESFKVYREGMEILKDCNGRIDRVEKKVLKMNEDGQTDEF